MKLYAMKNIMTGEYERDNYGAIIVNDFEPTIPEFRKYEIKVINLQEAPIRPCLWCQDKFDGEMRTKGSSVDTYHAKAVSWNFCPMCGRSLQND